MQKSFKKAIALLLCAVMLLGTAPLSGVFTASANSASTMETAEEISVGNKVTAEVTAGSYTYFKFIPEEDGKYVFTSDSDEDTTACLFDENGYELYYNDDSGINANFMIICSLVAEKTYYLGVRFLGGSLSGSFDVELSKWKDITGTWGENIAYCIGEDGTLTLTGSGEISGTSDEWDENYPWNYYNEIITKIVIGNGITSIPELAFNNLYYATSVTIPSTVSSIDLTAFNGNQSEIIVDSNNPYFVTDEYGVLYNADKTVLVRFPSKYDEEIEYTVPDSVEKIFDNAFNDVYNLTLVVKAPSAAFEYAISHGIKYKISSWDADITGTWGDNITYCISEDGTLTLIGSGEIRVNRGDIYDENGDWYYENYPWNSYRHFITKIVIGNGITSIPEYAFSGLNYAASVTIPATVSSIDEYAFKRYKFEIIVDSNNPYFIVDEYGALYNADKTVLVRFTSKSYEEIEYTIPDSVKKIYNGAFYDTYNVTLITKAPSVAFEYAVRNKLKYRISEWTADITGTWGDNITYCISEDGTLTLGGNGEMLNEYDEYNETDNTWHWFEYPWKNYNRFISGIIIGDGITSIGNFAFGNTQITEIEIPSNIKKIGNSAFSCCYSLETITFADGTVLESIGASAFSETAYYNNSDNWEDGVLYVGNYIVNAYSDVVGNVKNDANASTAYTVKDGTLGIADNAFDSCSYLTAVEIPSSVRFIGDYSFAYCGNLDTINVPDDSNLEFIGYNAFYYSKVYDNADSWENGAFYLGKVLLKTKYDTLPDTYTVKPGTKHIASDAFSGCKSLVSVTLPDSLVSIGNSAFLGCKNLTTIEIPASVTEIDDSAFYNCCNLVTVTFSENSNLEKIGNNAFYYCDSLSSINLPDGLKEIGNYAFYSCSVNTVEIPASVTKIGEHAFLDCWSLESIIVDSANEYYSSDENGVLFNKDKSLLILYPRNNSKNSYTIPDETLKIADYAFYNCYNLASVKLTDGLKSIGYNAFHNCINITSFEIPASVTEIGSEAFYYCLSLESITVDSTNEYYSSDENGVLFDKSKTNLIKYPSASSNKSYTVPSTVKNIQAYAFNESKNIENVYFEENSSLTVINEEAFANCSELKSIEIPASVLYLGYGTFRYCTSLSSLTFESSSNLRQIGGFAFYDCDSLVNVELPEKLEYISYCAFGYCDNLISVSIPASVKYIDTDVFYWHNEDLIIFGYAESFAEQYAFDNGIPFSILNGEAFVTINGPAAIDEPDFIVFGRATPYITVEVFDGEESLGTASSNGSGKWSGKFTFEEPENGSVHNITAKVTVGEDSVTTEPIGIIYDDGAIIAERFELYHNGSSVIVDESNVMNAIKYISVDPMQPFTFKVKVNREVDSLAVVSTKDGEIKMIDAAYDKASGYWIASGWFNPENHSYLPGTFSLEINGWESVDIYMRQMRYILDPSGVVYEAVKSNVVEGATATIQYKDKDGNAVIWNADEYNQVNPIITGSDGAFAWEVPEGEWRITVSKDGYETAYSDWMEVPPIRTGVDIPLISTQSPEVEYINVYEDGVEIKFTQYMNIDSVNTNSVAIICNGEYVEGTLEALNAEASGTDGSVNYATTFMFTPNNKLSGKIEVAVYDVQNYCGTYMYDYYFENFEISKKIETLTATASVDAKMNEKVYVTVTASPADAAYGKTVVASMNNSYILNPENSQLTFNENGVAVFCFDAVLAGTTDINFTVNGTTLNANTSVNIENYEPAPRPILVSTITLDKTEATLFVDEKLSLSAAVSPENATNKGIVWKSENTSVATVDENGTITAVSDGYANIIAKSENSNVTATCTVRVIKRNYTVTWIVDDKETTQTVATGAAIEEPATPVKEGYTFVGWSPAVPDTMPAYDLSFTAVFGKSAKVDIVGGTVTSGNLTLGSSITVKAEEIDGKVFSHWTVNGATVKDASSAETTVVLDSEEITITAEYDDCSCNCHKGGIAGFFYKILLFFQKLFGNNLECFCGAKH